MLSKISPVLLLKKTFLAIALFAALFAGANSGNFYAPCYYQGACASTYAAYNQPSYMPINYFGGYYNSQAYANSYYGQGSAYANGGYNYPPSYTSAYVGYEPGYYSYSTAQPTLNYGFYSPGQVQANSYTNPYGYSPNSNSYSNSYAYSPAAYSNGYAYASGSGNGQGYSSPIYSSYSMPASAYQYGNGASASANGYQYANGGAAHPYWLNGPNYWYGQPYPAQGSYSLQGAMGLSTSPTFPPYFQSNFGQNANYYVQ